MGSSLGYFPHSLSDGILSSGKFTTLVVNCGIIKLLKSLSFLLENVRDSLFFV